MNSNELLTIINYMEKDRGIDRELLFEAVEFALQSASKRDLDTEAEIRIAIDRESGEMRAFATLEVVEEVADKDVEISVADAQKINPEAEIGDDVETEIKPKNLGRIAAQTAKQAILQKIRQAERSIVYDEYKDRIGDIISGSVRQFNRSDIIVDLGRAEAVMPSSERVPTEEYQVGERVRGFITEVKDNPAGPSVVLSRAHPDFVKALFRLEVSEIADGIVEVMGIAREPGYRTKIAVTSKDDKVDPVGACVGMRGIRVKNIVRELSGEKIDIIRWSPDVKTYVTNALSPAKLTKVTIDPDNERLVHVVTDADQLSLAIGKRGQNVRLCAKLLSLKIDIQKDQADETFEEKVARAVTDLATIDGIDKEKAQALVNAGFLTIEGILSAEATDLVEMAGFDAETAKSVYAAALSKSAGDGAAPAVEEQQPEADAEGDAAVPEEVPE